MFNSNNNRYVSDLVSQKLHPIIIILLWELIDDIPERERDYLQIFNLTIDGNDGRHQIVEHTQENPYYKNNKTFFTINAVNATVYCIDNCQGTQIMMFAEEY